MLSFSALRTLGRSAAKAPAGTPKKPGSSATGASTQPTPRTSLSQVPGVRTVQTASGVPNAQPVPAGTSAAPSGVSPLSAYDYGASPTMVNVGASQFTSSSALAQGGRVVTGPGGVTRMVPAPPGPGSGGGGGTGPGSGSGGGGGTGPGSGTGTGSPTLAGPPNIAPGFRESAGSMAGGDTSKPTYKASQIAQDYGLSQTGQQFLSDYLSGKLPAAQEAELKQAQDEADAQIKSSLASMGIDPNSTMGRSAIDQAHTQVLAAKASMLQSELTNAFNSFGMSESMMQYFTPTQVATTAGQYRVKVAETMGNYQTAQNTGSGLFGLLSGLLGGL